MRVREGSKPLFQNRPLVRFSTELKYSQNNFHHVSLKNKNLYEGSQFGNFQNLAFSATNRFTEEMPSKWLFGVKMEVFQSFQM